MNGPGTLAPRDLLAHDDGGTPWPVAPGDAPGYDARAAYRDALAVRALRVARGEVPRGFKVGFTNRGLWVRYGVAAPIWGTVWDATLACCEGAGTLSLARTCEPRLEPEAVFGLASTPPPGAGLDALYASLEWVAPGFEVVQSHRPGWKFRASDTMADNGLHARLLVGPRVPVRDIAQDAAGLDARLAACGVRLFRGDVLVETGRGANVLDGPLRALHHFLAELRACPGAPDLAAGDVVTTGTWTDAWPVAPGERWRADFDAPLAPLAVDFR